MVKGEMVHREQGGDTGNCFFVKFPCGNDIYKWRNGELLLESE